MSTFILRGRWHGDEIDPTRRFVGKVENGGTTGLEPGAQVVVTFQNDDFLLHTRPFQAHGRYSLEGMPSDTFVLTSFLRKDGASVQEATREGEEQLWGGEIFEKQPTAMRS